MKLSNEEVDYLWTKIETSKKKKAIHSENELFTLLNTRKTTFTDEEFTKIIQSLEFSFRKRLNGEKPDLKNELYLSIKSKIPDTLIIVKQGSINRKPSKNSTKIEIITYLKRKNIAFDEKSTKATLLGLFEKMNIKTFDGFINL